MYGKLGALLAFALGVAIGYKWPVIRRILVFSSRKVEKGAVKSYLTVKDGISSVSGRLRGVTAEVAPAPESKS